MNTGTGKPVGDETLKGTARSLLMSVNEASIAARNGWLFFLALLAYLFIAAASVSHKDLLLNAPVVLPFLGIALRLDSFFLFGPLVLLFVHFGLLVQHVLLSRKIIELDTILVEDEAWRGKRRHPLRLELHSYFYTQALAGSNRSAVFAMFLHGMVWLSLVLLPVFLILYFQVAPAGCSGPGRPAGPPHQAPRLPSPAQPPAGRTCRSSCGASGRNKG